jgi:hypothetical protein
MSLDQQGYVWLSDPWIAAFTIVVAIGLVLWCHVRLSGADVEPSASQSTRLRSTAPTMRPGSVSGGANLSCSVTAGREHRDAQRRRVA